MVRTCDYIVSFAKFSTTVDLGYPDSPLVHWPIGKPGNYTLLLSQKSLKRVPLLLLQ